MGEGKKPIFEATFSRSVKIQGGDDRLTSDAGLLLLREADHKLGLIDSLASGLSDPRRPELIRYQMSELLRERIYALALGYQAQDDVDRLAHDPAMRMATWDRPGDAVLEVRLASQPTRSRLIDTLAHQEGNVEERSDLSVVPAGVQYGQHAAWRTRRLAGRLLGSETFSQIRAQGWRPSR